MKNNCIIATLLLLCLVVGCKENQFDENGNWDKEKIDWDVASAFELPPSTGTERDWQDVIHNELSQKEGWESLKKEHRLDDGTRVDLLFPEQACEIDWADKWAEGVGQSIYYGLKTDRSPLVILLSKKSGWKKYRDRVEYCGVECWVYDTRLKDWVDKD